MNKTAISALVGLAALITAILKIGVYVGQVDQRLVKAEERAQRAESRVSDMADQLDRLLWRDQFLHGQFPVPKE